MESETYHIGLWNYARNFYFAANNLREQNNRTISAPVYYLYGHAIELVLKSILIFEGNSENDIKIIGHNLLKAWEHASSYDLSLQQSESTELTQTIEMINPYYEGKELEYIVSGGKRYPELVHMHNVAINLILAIGKYIQIPNTQLNNTLHPSAKSGAG